MSSYFSLVLLTFLLAGQELAKGQVLPSVYQYYTEGGIVSGLEALQTGFQLNGKNITIQSGALHYFRVHPGYWRDRLQKLRATGLIAVETYVPWNLHEPERDVFDFGDGNRDFSEFLDLPEFLKIAQEEDLLVILRPGPYIGGDWDMGGLPSWLLNIPDIKMRTSEAQYIERVTNYFNTLLPLVRDLQFTNNGSIIAVQLENDYSLVGYNEGPDQEYLRILKTLMDSNGIDSLLTTSDSDLVDEASIPEALRTVIFQTNAEGYLEYLVRKQPDKPPMVMEFRTGLFDHWMNPTRRLNFSPLAYRQVLESIMQFPASFNLYMFHGGSSFGFLSGVNTLSSKFGSMFDVTSYDYDAPLSEAGDYTEKYNITKELVEKYQPVKFLRPEQPPQTTKVGYLELIARYLDMESIFQLAGPPIKSADVVNMESLDINGGNGQSYGYTWYRKSNISINTGDVLKITGHVHDHCQVFVDGLLQTRILHSNDDVNGFGFWKQEDAEIFLMDQGSTLDLLVENMGRISYGLNAYDDKKGLFEGPVVLNGQNLSDWEIVPLEFKKSWMQSLKNAPWKKFDMAPGTVAPGLYATTLTITETNIAADTFVSGANWNKGLVFVNGFNLGRYNKLGPQHRLYLPAHLLVPGDNEIIFFEQFVPTGFFRAYSEPELN